MTKLLKIRFVKFEKALTAQQLEAYGFDFINDDSAHIRVCRTGFYLHGGGIFIAPKTINTISSLIFNDNARRDKYLKNVVKWISEERFAMGGKLRIGELCKFSDDGEKWYLGKYAGKCAEQLGEPRFLSGFREATSLTRWKYARANGGRLKIDGDVYSWEMEVEDEK